jgi:hypothetical protein
MKTRTTIVLVAAGFALSFAFNAVVMPKAVKAAIATLIRDQDNAARRPFTTSCRNVSAAFVVACNTPPIPAGEEVVVESISFSVSSDHSNSVLNVSLSTVESGSQNNFVANTLFDSGFLQPSQADFEGGQSVRLYADPGTVISCAAATHGPNPSSGLGMFCFISGYSVLLP